MKSKQLLSIVLSLIMFTGVSAGSAAFAESHDDLDDIIDDFCEIDATEHDAFFDANPDLVDFRTTIVDICTIEDLDEREDAIDLFVEDNFPEAIDDDVIEDFKDCVEAGGIIGDNLNECTIDDMVFVNDEDDDDNDHDKVFVCHKDKKTLSIGADALTAHLNHGDTEGYCDGVTRADYMHDKYSNKGPGNLRDHFAMYCDMTAEERAEKMEAKHDDLPDDLRADLARYCEMTDDEQDDFRDIMMDRMDELHDSMKDNMKDFKKETKMLVDGMKDKHKDYSKYCEMTEEERAVSIDSLEKLERISEWCDMTPEQRDDLKRELHDAAKDLKEKRHTALERMKDNSDLSPRIKAMIMDKHDITDERMDEIKMKFKEKHGDLTDEQRSDLKDKFKKHMKKVKSNLTDEQKSDIHDRIAEMKAFKADLRERASEMTDEEKQELRAEFIEKAKDMRHAWISPRTQMTAGLDAADVECREGFNLVMKASNGVAMCLKADTALKMIDRGIAVPAN